VQSKRIAAEGEREYIFVRDGHPAVVKRESGSQVRGLIMSDMMFFSALTPGMQFFAFTH
jgi:hypothetical protein